MIPSKISDEKGREYTVTAIGNKAFKGSAVTSVSIPATVTELGEEAFRECRSLSRVEMTPMKVMPRAVFFDCPNITDFNLDGIEEIKHGAFSGTGLKTLTIPASVNKIGEFAFSRIHNLSIVNIPAGDQTLHFEGAVFWDTPIKNLYLDRVIDSESPNADNAYNANRPFNHNPYLASVEIGPDLNRIPSDLLDGCSGIRKIIIRDLNYSDESMASIEKIMKEVPHAKLITNDGRAYDYASLQTTKEYNKTYRRMLEAVKKRDTYGMQLGYSFFTNNINYLIVYPDNFRKLLNDIVEEMDKSWKNLTVTNETDAISGVANSYLALIGIENRCLAKVGNIEDWAQYDLLRSDRYKSTHNHDYEQILRLADIALNYAPGNKGYTAALKLAALCGLGRWSEAAAYFKTAKNAATNNGRYMVPPEFNYLEKVIRENGGKIGNGANKKSAGSKKSKGKRR